MPGFVLTNKAMADLKAIGRYTAETWGREQRNRYLALLDGCFHELAANPLKGLDCGSILPRLSQAGSGAAYCLLPFDCR